jgi:alcohol dehydrogenase (cytochrome c)
VRLPFVFLLMAILATAQPPTPAQAAGVEDGKDLFESLCAGCHGLDGAGGERGPNILESTRARKMTPAELQAFIRAGVPGAGMPGFALPDSQLRPLVTFVRSLYAVAADIDVPGDVAAGERFFLGKGNCLSCHMLNGHGGLLGPDLSNLGREKKLSEIEESLRTPNSRISPGHRVITVRLRDGRVVRGFSLNESNYDLQLQDFAARIHLLRRDQIAAIQREAQSYMPPVQAGEEEFRNLLAYLSRLSRQPAQAAAAVVSNRNGLIDFSRGAEPKEGEWPTYHGQWGGNRYSRLNQIHAGNVAALAPRWMFPMRGSQSLEVTPVVVGNIMYVTTGNEAYALDARSGREIWHYQHPAPEGVVGDAAGGINRGVAVLGDRVFMATPSAHLIALQRFTGRLLWDTEMADYRQNYGATSAPLVIKDLVISGTSGGDEGIRGFLAAYKASTGERVWRFWTIPAPGEPLSETWVGKALDHGCASTWLTGTYDPQLDLLYWATGNPCPDFNGDERQGDNLYSDSVLALKPETGELRWYYQFTPHDVHDWDSEETPMVIDADYRGRRRQLLAQANRNGFYYLLDRTNGKLLQATPFVKNLTWASGIGPDGRPKMLPHTEPTAEGVKVCPAVEGATNWMSSSYNPLTKWLYVMALEKCSVYMRSSAVWSPGKSYYGGGTREVPNEPGTKVLKAIDLATGKIVWEYPQIGPATSWGGLLSTAGGLVFFGDDSGAFAAVEAPTGKPLWHFHTNQLWKASPMTYMVDGKQYVAIAAGSNILAFGLP